MNYRHTFHAGNPGDVLKHLVQVLILDHLRRKATPFVYVDTHAGRGLYDLAADAASRTGEHRQGIGRLWGQAPEDPALARYLAVIASFNFNSLNSADSTAGLASDARDASVAGDRGDDASALPPLRHYPGSPAIAQALMRVQDRAILCELHPGEHLALRRQLAGDPRIAIHHRDGYEGLAALLPSPCGRGLVLLDPPYERRDEEEALVAGICRGRRRFPTGIFAAWAPVKGDPGGTRGPSPLATRLVAAQLPATPILEVELTTADDPSGARMIGSRMVILDPPWRLDQTLCQALPGLARRLAGPPTGTAGRWRVDWLVRESPRGLSLRAGPSRRTR